MATGTSITTNRYADFLADRFADTNLYFALDHVRYADRTHDLVTFRNHGAVADHLRAGMKTGFHGTVFNGPRFWGLLCMPYANHAGPLDGFADGRCVLVGNFEGLVAIDRYLHFFFVGARVEDQTFFNCRHTASWLLLARSHSSTREHTALKMHIQTRIYIVHTYIL